MLPLCGVEWRAIFILGAHQRPQRHKHQNLALNFSVDISRKTCIIFGEATSPNMKDELLPTLSNNKVHQPLRNFLEQFLHHRRTLNPKFGLPHQIMKHLYHGQRTAVRNRLQNAIEFDVALNILGVRQLTEESEIVIQKLFVLGALG